MEYEDSGYIKDDEARDWDADALLQSLKDGTEQANAERRKRGFPELEVIGWVQAPRYDATTHRLVWSAAARDKNQRQQSAQVVNYKTYALGREGYITINLIASRNEIDQYKPQAATLLSSLEYNAGKRYGDFDSSTDKVAEYGIAALVTGVVAKKLGLFALAAAFFAKFFKLILVGCAVAFGGVAKFFRRKGS